jgi:hypothetical protein
MAYSPLPAKVTTDTITLTNYNTIKDDFAAGVPDIFTAKGDLAVGTAADAADRLGVGNDDDTLVADSSQPTGLAWQIQPATRVYHNATQTSTTAAWTTLAFNSERFDTNGMHDTVTNNSRLTVPTGGAGLYLTGATIFISSGTAPLMGLRLLLNGATVITEIENIDVAAAAALSISTLYALSVSDYIEIQVYCSQASTVPSSGNYSPEFWAIWQRRQ